MRPINAIVGLTLLASTAHAADISLSWQGDAHAVTYRIEQSALPASCLAGITWTPAKSNIPQPSPFPADKTVETTVTVPDTGLVLLRAVAINASQTSTRQEAGAFYNTLWAPMSVGKLGVD